MTEFLRRYATPLSLVTGLAISITGIMMFFGVRGELSDIHEWLGWAFVASLLMHIVRNWRGLLGMMKPWRSKIIVGVLGAAAVILVVTSLPTGGQAGQQGGPWLIVNRISEAPISVSAPALGMTANDLIAKLKAKGIAVTGPEQSIAEAARKQNTDARHVMFALVQHKD